MSGSDDILQSIPVGPSTIAPAPIFRDSDNPNVIWFQPSFGLQKDAGQNFLFAAIQTGQDQQGNPISQCQVTFTVIQTVPDEVVALRSANPTLEFRHVLFAPDFPI